MRKLPVYVMTAAIAMAGAASAATITSQAAVRACIIGGNGQQCGPASWTGVCIPGFGRPSMPGHGGFPDMSQPAVPGEGGSGLPDMNVPGMQPGNGSVDAFTARVAALVNEERARAGAAPLRVDSRVEAAASVRAREIERSFSHTRPDGSSFNFALAQSGAAFTGAGENIAYGQRTPEEVMKSWMNSQGHRANILNKNFTAIGVGYYQNGAGTGYWTQLFTQ